MDCQVAAGDIRRIVVNYNDPRNPSAHKRNRVGSGIGDSHIEAIQFKELSSDLRQFRV